VGSKNHVSDVGQNRTNSLQPRGVTSRRCGRLPNKFGRLFISISTFLHLGTEKSKKADAKWTAGGVHA